MNELIKKFLKKVLPPSQYKSLQKIYLHFRSKLYSRNLNELASIYGTDKWNSHWYTQHYQKIFSSIRKKKLNVLEIGVGGFDSPTEGGYSLKMWKYYFPKSKIYAIDIYDKSPLQEKRIKIFQGSQADEAFLKKMVSETGPLDIVIDDGSHISDHAIISFKTLFPLLKTGGVYIVEDTHTSYDKRWDGDSENLNNPKTTMGFFKILTDGLNYRHFTPPGYVPSYFDKQIISIQYFHNLIIVYKGIND